MPPLARAPAMSEKVDRECAHAVHRHAAGEALISAGVLAEAVHYGECDRSAGPRPRAVRERGAVGGFYESLGGNSPLRHRDARTLSGS